MAKILIAGDGSFGDMFPLYAVAERLRNRGHAVSIATTAANAKAIPSLNLPLIYLQPGISLPHNGQLSTPKRSEINRALAANGMKAELEVLLEQATEFDLIVGNQLAFSAAMASKLLQKPWVYCAASPIALPSRNAPPLLPYFERLQRQFQHPGFDRICLDLARGISRIKMWPTLQLQKKMGLSIAEHPRFEGMYSRQLNLLMVSPLLVEPATDWPTPTHLSGFTWFDPAFMRNPAKQARLDAFLRAGSPPVVFALGGNRRLWPGKFFTESIAACEQLGLRSIVVAAERFHPRISHGSSTLLTSYLPYADIFPKVAAIVHSGGIGTIGWSMRFAIPSLLSPTGVDQFDNAWLACNKGHAHPIEARHYSASSVARALTGLLEDKALKHRLEQCAQYLANEDGAGAAAGHIEQLLAP